MKSKRLLNVVKTIIVGATATVGLSSCCNTDDRKTYNIYDRIRKSVDFTKHLAACRGNNLYESKHTIISL